MTSILNAYTSTSTALVWNVSHAGGALGGTPSGWGAVGFDDSAWAVPVECGGISYFYSTFNAAQGTSPSPSEYIAPIEATGNVYDNLVWLVRIPFSLAGAPTVANILQKWADDTALYYINETLVTPGIGGDIDVGAFVSGANVLGIQVTNSGLNNKWSGGDPTTVSMRLFSDVDAPPPPVPEPGVVIDPTAAEPIPIGDDIITWVITRGSGPEITSGANPGAATIVVKNSIAAGADSDNKYNPDNPSSPLIDYLRDGTAIHISVNADGTLEGDDPKGLFGGRTLDITVLPSGGAEVPPTVEIVCEDALGWLGRTPIDIGYATGRSQGALRSAILAAAGESRLDLAHEILTMPLSSASGDALRALEDLNKSNGTRHFAKPADDPADWYTYTTRNRQWRLDATVDFTLSQLDDHVTSMNGWRLSADTVTNQQKASVTPIRFTPSTYTVWEQNPLPLIVTPERPFDLWIDFDDYTQAPIVNSASSGDTPIIVLTTFGDRAHLAIAVSPGDTCTFTHLTIEGAIARRGTAESWVANDTASQTLPRGISEGSEISGEYVGTLSSARGIAEHIVWRYGSPQTRPQLVIENWIPDMFDIDLYDTIGYTSPQIDVADVVFEVVGYTMVGNVAAKDADDNPVVHHVLTLVLQKSRVQTDPGWFVLDTDELDDPARFLAY